MSKQTELAQVADTITVNSGNVGIGTSSPDQSLTIGAGGKVRLYRGDNTRYGDIYTDNNFLNIETSNDPIKLGGQSYIRFDTNSTERMRLDASGNLLVGTTDLLPADNAVEGFVYKSGLSMQVHRDAGPALGLGRGTSDGSILNFLKDGSTVGSIGAFGNNLTLNSEGAGGYGRLQTQGVDRFIWYQGGFYPAIDNIYDLGVASSRRWNDAYITNGVTTGSDGNDKQDIRDLTEAEQRVAVACKGLLKAWRWKSAVEEKGDDARIHCGIIAQDLQAAFAAEGLDAGRYAMFMSNTWWEHDVEVPAVEAVAEVTETTTDEGGNEVVTVITEAVEAVDAYTRTDTYETQEEAPEGATERTRLGVRYSELLAFIIGAL